MEDSRLVLGLAGAAAALLVGYRLQYSKRWHSANRAVVPKRDRSAIYSTQFSDVLEERVVIALVGLPARGKSFISKGIVRYLCFLGSRCKIFNAGNKRRDAGKGGASASFFDPRNQAAQLHKEQMAMETLDELIEWLGNEKGLACGIFDATNTTVARRHAVLERCALRFF